MFVPTPASLQIAGNPCLETGTTRALLASDASHPGPDMLHAIAMLSNITMAGMGCTAYRLDWTGRSVHCASCVCSTVLSLHAWPVDAVV